MKCITREIINIKSSIVIILFVILSLSQLSCRNTTTTTTRVPPRPYHPIIIVWSCWLYLRQLFNHNRKQGSAQFQWRMHALQIFAVKCWWRHSGGGSSREKQCTNGQSVHSEHTRSKWNWISAQFIWWARTYSIDSTYIFVFKNLTFTMLHIGLPYRLAAMLVIWKFNCLFEF